MTENRNTKPSAPRVENLPAQLKAKPRWVLFDVFTDPTGHVNKHPKNARTGGNAMINNQTTWADFATVSAAQKNNRLAQLGYATGDGVVAIDLDHVIVKGELLPQAREVVEQLNSYTEVSVSGTGLHVICNGALPIKDGDTGTKRKFKLAEGADIELFYGKQFIVLTGDIYEGRNTMRNCGAELGQLWEKYTAGEQAKQEKMELRQPATPNDIDDRELITKACDTDEQFKRLWEGDISACKGDGSHSAADFALCCKLAFWTGRDAGRIDTLFRQSGLYRPKWDKKHGGATYGQITIMNAVTSCNDTYLPKHQRTETPMHQNTKTPNNQYTDTPTHQSTTAEQAEQIDYAEEYYEKHPVSPFTLSPITFYLDQQFANDVTEYNETSLRRSGFKLLDQKLGSLRPELYMFGALTGLGKTTFALQLADQLAEQGEPVIYFSFEQTRHDIVAKSLARYSHKCGTFETQNSDLWPLTSENFRTGQLNSAGKAAMQKYKDTHSNLFYIVDINDTHFNVSVDNVVQAIDYYCEQFQITPCVFIDYLQVMHATNQRADMRAQTDEIVNKLKQCQQRHKMFMFVISAFNRENYINPVSLESFKESGRIDYTAGTILGMQYAVMGHDESGIFTGETDKSKNFRRKIIREEQSRPDGKYLQIVALKTRYGQSQWAVDFIVNHQHETFTEITEEDFKKREQYDDTQQANTQANRKLPANKNKQRPK